MNEGRNNCYSVYFKLPNGTVHKKMLLALTSLDARKSVHKVFPEAQILGIVEEV